MIWLHDFLAPNTENETDDAILWNFSDVSENLLIKNEIKSKTSDNLGRLFPESVFPEKWFLKLQ